MSEQPDLSILIVNYFTEAYLRQCLASVRESLGSVRAEIIVVDNGSPPGEFEALESEFPDATWIRAERNGGFAAGNNLAAGHASGRYLLLLNPDVEAPRGALDRMVRIADAHPDIGVAGGVTVSPSGRSWLSKAELDNPEADAVDVRHVIGACMLIRRETWEQCGPLDERFFLFQEDLEYCYRAAARGWRVCRLPTVTVKHHGGSSYPGLDSLGVTRQRVLSYLIYCRHSLSPLKLAIRVTGFALHAGWHVLYYTVKSVNKQPGTIRKKHRFIGRLQALSLWIRGRTTTDDFGRTDDQRRNESG